MVYFLPPAAWARPYPSVDPAIFSQSAATAQTLMNDAGVILKRLAESRSFAATIMSAAQEGKTEEVKRLIRSQTEVYFNPDGIRLTLSPPPGAFPCCQLAIGLRWNVFPPFHV
ncbi:hypothetical protein ABES66_01670 [Geobacillus stearothermophilus]|uniref:hypothetical protein n=1 Tax=Geobacillus stearothermophilus TaxID=1422 RepID=UPI000518B6A1|nr:hypothetical protein [Geobacillus stearothermophilus]MED3776513.1 hypothetical protein [Geobacillus stearothermophilus]MED4334394.1 hypothetical protein [Geobacillus stearothermophilus]MED4831876.1 hypothetical protein [Geobacillus stearothermophilus]MED4962171.1 hypothetical protein [Geobacillus stearothermophilus]MED4996378.1 hypothetical protein [Geobacillus stearothermophilus]